MEPGGGVVPVTAALRTCSVVDDGCERPAGLRVGSGLAILDASDMDGPIATCHACDDDVCRACSKVVPWKCFDKAAVEYKVRRCRICNNCIESDGGEK